nr:MAG TPA: hypothetical protein [Caudoviricetes sp.]
MYTLLILYTYQTKDMQNKRNKNITQKKKKEKKNVYNI